MKKTQKKTRPAKSATNGKTRITQAKAQQAEALIEQAKAREEQAKAREEQAKAREEQAKAQTERVRARAEQAETVLKTVLRKGVLPKDVVLENATEPRLLNPPSERKTVGEKSALGRLPERQREILRLIAVGKNTKQIGEALKLSPKTVEYHRMKLMYSLNLHDVPGLVRFAMREGLIPEES